LRLVNQWVGRVVSCEKQAFPHQAAPFEVRAMDMQSHKPPVIASTFPHVAPARIMPTRRGTTALSTPLHTDQFRPVALPAAPRPASDILSLQAAT
jgi:hypothetical protein